MYVPAHKLLENVTPWLYPIVLNGQVGFRELLNTKAETLGNSSTSPDKELESIIYSLVRNNPFAAPYPKSCDSCKIQFSEYTYKVLGSRYISEVDAELQISSDIFFYYILLGLTLRPKLLTS